MVSAKAKRGIWIVRSRWNSLNCVCVGVCAGWGGGSFSEALSDKEVRQRAMYIEGGRIFQAREEQMQRPRVGHMLSVFKEHQGGYQ